MVTSSWVLHDNPLLSPCCNTVSILCMSKWFKIVLKDDCFAAYKHVSDT